jgi:heme-degrading monooxygenase HmoA
MAIGFIAYHYPRPEHFAPFVERTRVVQKTLRSQPGCRSVEIWATPDRDAVITTGTFDSEQDYQRAFGVARGLGEPVVFDDRERKPREIVTLLSQ